MRILNVGNQNLVPALRGMGHDVFSVSSLDAGANLHLSHPVVWSRLLPRLRGFEPDLLFWFDDGNLPQVVGLEELACLSVFCSIDTFCNPWHVPFAQAFDLVLAAQKDHLSLFEKAGLDPVWFPLFYSGQVRSEDEQTWLEQRRLAAAFVGTLNPRNIPGRLPFLQRTSALFPLHFAQGDFEPVFRQARIVLNQSAAGELNYRCFEAMGCGAALLHDSELEGFADLFTPGINVLPAYTRGNAAEAATVLNFWNARPERLATVARAGSALIAAAHTAEIRAGQLLALLEIPLRQQLWRKRLLDLPRRRILLSSAYAILGLELPATLPEHKDFYLGLANLLYPTSRSV